MFFPKKLIEKILFALVFITIIIGVYLSRTNLTFFEGTYVREDGPLEWLTVLALGLSVFLCFYRAKILKPFRGRRFIAGLYLLSAVFFFGLAEEISWGQRIIEQFMDFKVPDFFLQYNTQREMNFHNLRFGDMKINKIIFGTTLGIFVVFYFLILPYFYRRKEGVRDWINRYALPIPNHYHVIAYIALAALASFIAGGKKGEILEFGGCWIVFIMLIEPLNREMFSRKSFQR